MKFIYLILLLMLTCVWPACTTIRHAGPLAYAALRGHPTFNRFWPSLSKRIAQQSPLNDTVDSTRDRSSIDDSSTTYVNSNFNSTTTDVNSTRDINSTGYANPNGDRFT